MRKPIEQTIRVLLADDHRLVRESVGRLLQDDPGIEIIGEAGDGRTAAKLAASLRPDIVITDVTMPELNGIDLIRALRQDRTNAKVILLTMHASELFVLDAVELGANGYVLKTATPDELKMAVRAVANDQTYFSPGVSSILAQYVRRGQSPREGGILSGREREVLQLIAEGKTLTEIGTRLSISVKTVKNHRDHISNKLGCRSTASLVKSALRLGLTTDASGR